MGKNVYWISGTLIAIRLFIGLGIVSIPQSAVAFWPFSVTEASGIISPTAFIHDSSIPLLEAATNTDPNPEKGGALLSLSSDSALMANTGPGGSLADVLTTPTGNGSISVYTVKQGDSISVIAESFGVSTDTILWANNLTRKSAITPGMTLVILPVSGIQHTVAKGETLAGLAKKYGADADGIATFNGLESDATLVSGSTLIIPGGELQAASIVAKSTATKTSTAIKTGGGLSSIQANPYKGGSGAALNGFFGNPLPGARLTQSIHGWNGVDIGAPSDTPIHAAAFGTVIVSRVGGWNGGYGNYVVIDHGNGTQTLYAHLSTDSVSVGQSVTKGQVIGTVGRTGEATGNHLHFEVRGARNPFADCAVMTVCTPK